MKIAITGHSRGIGKALYDALSDGHDVEGFSRSNGFDINDPNLIVRAVKKHDVFVNNAYDSISQVTILNMLWAKWKYDETKTIVNIISMSKYPGLSGNEAGYSAHKAALSHQAFLLMFKGNRKCIGTEYMIKSIGNQKPHIPKLSSIAVSLYLFIARMNKLFPVSSIFSVICITYSLHK